MQHTDSTPSNSHIRWFLTKKILPLTLSAPPNSARGSRKERGKKEEKFFNQL